MRCAGSLPGRFLRPSFRRPAMLHVGRNSEREHAKRTSRQFGRHVDCGHGAGALGAAGDEQSQGLPTSRKIDCFRHCRITNSVQDHRVFPAFLPGRRPAFRNRSRMDLSPHRTSLGISRRPGKAGRSLRRANHGLLPSPGTEAKVWSLAECKEVTLGAL